MISIETLGKRIVLLNAKINKYNNLKITTFSILDKGQLENERQKLLMMLMHSNDDVKGEDIITTIKPGERGIVDVVMIIDKLRYKRPVEK